MYVCTDPKCPNTFTSSLREYERDNKNGELAQLFHSQEFQTEVQAILTKEQEVRDERRAVLYAKFEKEMGG